MTRTTGWARLPLELRERPQWAVAGASKAPMARGPKGRPVHVGVTSPSQWMSFNDACAYAWELRDAVTVWTNPQTGVTTTQTGYTVGYILNEADPFTCVDLDVKDATTHPDEPAKWTTTADIDRYQAIIRTLDSYTERSKSAKGIHIWVRGKIGRGYRRDGVEVYSQERFIICTGDVWIDKPIAEREFILNNMVTRMRPVEKATTLVEIPQEADDWYILQVAINAANNEKFEDLWRGKWREYSFPSQSEADLALMSMFTFYSESNEQCKRLFRESGLGKREKAVKDDKYLKFTLTIIRERQARERNIEMQGILNAAERVQELSRAAIAAMQGGAPATPVVDGVFGPQVARELVPLHVPGAGDAVVTLSPPETLMAQLTPVSKSALDAGEKGLPWPPGMMGTIARHIYSSSFLPIKEVSIVAALGMMAGICGKAWHIPQSGLNLYIVLVARSAIGKEAMHHGVASLVSSCIQKHPSFGSYVDFREYASGPALMKACAAQDSFVNISGEWGRRMKRIAMEDEREGPMSTLRTQMTNLYQKSAPKSIVGGLGYSAQDNNVEMLHAVAYSMIGESTPQTFYDSLTESMMEDGFLSRFLVIQYEGDRPDENTNIVDIPDEALVDALCAIANQADVLNKQMISGSTLVGRTEEAAVMLAAFGKQAANNIRGTEDESRRQMWNRATLKVLRVAALLAVVDNYLNPVITLDQAVWAVKLIESDIKIMSARLVQGDVGLGDNSREKKIVAIIQAYEAKAPAPGYKVPEGMRESGIITRQYIQSRTNRVSAFLKHRLGPSTALDHTIRQMIDNGYLMEVKADKLSEIYNFNGKAYRILRLPDYNAMT